MTIYYIRLSKNEKFFYNKLTNYYEEGIHRGTMYLTLTDAIRDLISTPLADTGEVVAYRLEEIG